MKIKKKRINKLFSDTQIYNKIDSNLRAFIL